MPKIVKEEYCFGCESLLLVESEKHGPFCGDCFRKTKRKDALMEAAVKQAVVTVVPMVCPHDDERGHRCRIRFNVLVLDKNLEPKQITGPYSEREAERHAKQMRKRIDRRRKP